VLAVLPEPADRATVLREAANALAALDPAEAALAGQHAWNDAAQFLRRLAAEPAAAGPDQTRAEQPDVDPVYDPKAWETYRRDAGCGCTAPAPVDCKVPHGTGAWLCVCHRLAGPATTDPGKPLALLSGDVSKHFLEPNRCLSVDGTFRCSRPVDHPGDHRMGRTFWGRRAEDAAPAVGGAQQPKGVDGNRVVAYRSALPGAWSIYCTRHTSELGDGVIPLTTDDLPDGGLCASCGADVLIEQQPKEAGR
jgi:hypothetical protein